MAPSTTSPKAVPTFKKALQRPGRSVGKVQAHTEITSMSGPSQDIATKGDSELTKDFRSDLQSIRALVTCTICDQLLYEPWTLLCGHTYCYSCLCSWFLPNKRKKTCPDCRNVVRQMPAPSFVIKQMVEVLIKRAELMPIDENIAQHQERRATENNLVEADRASETGPFKGCFSKQPLSYLQFNEEDRLYRCSRCAHEYNGGPICENCGTDFGGDEEGIDLDLDGFSDVDAELSVDEFGYHVDHDEESDDDNDDAEIEDIDNMAHGVGFFGEQVSPLFTHLGHHEPNPVAWNSSRIIIGERGSASSDSESNEDEEETESMRDFIEDDEPGYGEPNSYHSPGSASHASLSSGGSDKVTDDDDNDDADASSDEGAAVSGGRRRVQTVRPALGAIPSVVAVSESAPNSEAGDLAEESRRLVQSGWSPLEQEPDSDPGEHQPFVSHDGSADSDTEATVGNQASDDEYEGDDYVAPDWTNSRSAHARLQAIEDQSDIYRYDSDGRDTNLTDREGDIEMSVSPIPPRRNSTVSGNSDQRSRRSVEILGPANTLYEAEEDSSDGTVQPANRRRRQPRYLGQSQTSGYDPRISMMFAQHQLDLRDMTAQQSPYFDPTLRSRAASSYRSLPARASGLSNYPSASAAVILTSVSNRPNRVQRQYPRRYFY